MILSFYCVQFFVRTTYFESEYVDFKTIDSRRNRITHDYLNVKLHASSEELNKDSNIVEIDELYAQTLSVLILAKYAVLYIVSAISISENKKQNGNNRTVEIEYQSKPGQSYL